MNQTETPDQFEADLEALTIHEAGHWHASVAFGIPAAMRIDMDAEGHLVGGWCFRDFHGSKFEGACIGWAGVMAEHMLNRVWRHRTPLLFSPLTEANLSKFHWEASFFLNELSVEDRQHIVAHTDTLESCQAAFRILSKRIGEIEADAKLLADRTRKEVAAKLAAADERKWGRIPRPPHIPATHADFLNQVCGNDAERFEQFIVSRAALHLTNNRTMKIEDAKLSLGAAFDDAVAISMNLQRKQYGGDFPDQDSWLSAARDFLNWTSEKK